MRDEEFEELYESHAQALFGFLVYRTGDRALAEDVLADTFEKALRARRRFDPRKASRKTWLYSIALNCLTDHRRRQAAEGRAVERAGAVAEVATRQDPFTEVEQRTALGAALATLSADEREAVALRYGADLTLPEIAALIGERLTTVEGRVYRALRKLRETLE